MKTEQEIIREYLSRKAKARWANPEFRAKQMESRRRWWADPANRQKHKDGQKKRWEKDNG